MILADSVSYHPDEVESMSPKLLLREVKTSDCVRPQSTQHSHEG